MKYNLLFYFRDSLIATSGIRGDFLDVSNLPDFLGKTPQERILKWKAYKSKMGIALVNTAQEGQGANLNTIYSGYDDTVSGQALQAIQLAIQQTEDTCSSITGVYREQLGGIEQKDAVTNVQVGINQSTVVTKQFFQIMDNITTELLIDALNVCKIAFKEGMIGSVVLGDKLQKIFTIDPQYFSFTDYDVHIADSADIMQDINKIEQLTYKLIESGQVDFDIIFEGITSESLSDMKHELLKACRKRKDENNQVQQASQQIQQYEQQLKELQANLQKAQQQLEQANGQELQLKAKKIEYDYEVAKEANNIKENTDSKKLDINNKEVEVQIAQVYDNNPYNDKIKKS